MKKHILFTGILAATVLLSFNSQAQKSESIEKKSETKDGKTKEIIIRKNGDKETKTTIEIDGDNITVNGKPLADYHGDDVSIIKRDIRDRSHNFLITPGNGNDMELNAFGNDWDNDVDLGDDNGRTRPFLGVMTEKTSDGAKITSVVKGSAAEKAGLQKDDIITSLNDKKIASPEELMDVVKTYKPADNVKIDYLRNNKKKDLNVKLGEKKDRNRTFVYNYNKDLGNGFNFKMPPMPPMPRMPKTFFKYKSWSGNTPKLGLKIEDVENDGGVKIVNVEEGSAAEKAGLKKDDVITEVNGEKVSNVDEVRDQVNDTEDKESVSLKAKRNNNEMKFEIKIPKQVNSADL
jgi:serine protease Do